MDEYDMVELTANVAISIQVRRDHRREDIDRALARLGAYLLDNGPINQYREDNGLTRVYIGPAKHLS